MSLHRFPCRLSFVVVLALMLVGTGIAQTFTSLASFNGAGGQYPAAPLVQGLDGNFYGTTSTGGAFGGGTFFKITPSGTLTTLHSMYDPTDGSNPFAALAQAANGNFYGTNTVGGTNQHGTIFQVTPSGHLSTLYSFCAQNNCADGNQPSAGLLLASDGNFYGTTSQGGAYGSGSVFKITLAGKLTTVYSFCPQAGCPDGNQPIAPLIQAADGNFYSTTYAGGAYGDGTVFKLTPAGQLTTLHSFCGSVLCPDGQHPYGGGLVQGSDGNFYGTTPFGGSGNYGTVFQIAPSGKLTVLHSFTGSDGQAPYAGLLQATDGNLYGITQIGGNNNSGTVFEITTTGTLTVLYSLCSLPGCTDGSIGYAGLIQSTNGTLYGPTEYGGASSNACRGGPGGCGTIFSLSTGLGPFVETLPATGKIGARVVILGNSLSGASKVTFHGTAAVFTVVSNTEISTTVPAGATTGEVEVTTLSGTVRSNAIFRVSP